MDACRLTSRLSGVARCAVLTICGCYVLRGFDEKLRQRKKMSGFGRRVLLVMAHLVTISLARHQMRSDEDTVGAPPLGQVQPGICSYGQTTSCCLGWKNVSGVCQPLCKQSCVHGQCVAPDKCLCRAGYQGPRCDEDANECGLSARPCSQRCMNTQGSYRCYCEPGYTLSVDEHTCTRQTTCASLRCQFGCQMAAGGGTGAGTVRCLCPPGLHLAPDNRTCTDINECQHHVDVCPLRWTCKNTFGSFACVCQEGFVMGTLQGSVQCRDMDECLTGSHGCSRHAQCINTEGSYTCRCLKTYTGNGNTCWPRRAAHYAKPPLYLNYKLSKRSGARRSSSLYPNIYNLIKRGSK
uniref:epidermal growth factor-like protein 6 isoform X2 n=1 Tax=Doryrhamphus excisus TaxID=161450 RepID=UPI0025AE01B7|nr:epidermal growth factor-like protein 6 isoform X2 [Doryrhamphus excisus]